MRLTDDLKYTDQLLQLTKEFSSKFLSATDKLAPHKEIRSLPSVSLPVAGLGGVATLEKFRQHYGDALTAATGPRYWGFVTGGVTPAALMGDWITSVLDLNGSNSGSVAAHIEKDVVEQLRKLFGLPEQFLGAFVSGATMANFTGLAMARQWIGEQQGVNIAADGLSAVKDIKVLAAVPHSSILKSMSMLGIGRNNLVRIPAIPNRESIDLHALEYYLREHPGQSFIIVASAGTVNTVDFDDIAALAVLKKKYNCWLHVDAAFGGFAACSEDFAHLLQGWEEADSITVDAHKWLNVPYDAAMIFARHPALQLSVFQNPGAAYLGDPFASFHYSNYIPENSRRLRALPVWFTLQAYGQEGYRYIVDNNVRLARKLGTYIAAEPALKLLAPVRLCVVCFTLDVAAAEQEAAVDGLLERINNSGVVYMTRTVYAGQAAIRAALVNWRTTDKDIEIVWATMQKMLIRK
ncbi:aminotransferase class I/II-fold pyridoxal phosphate-dependent enzyme [Chitinophaga sp. Cy-1792]|uniref:pyridoxal phosphate-dependent decarboxylase family protein n=1 Tax=Chitinophaga sp. Cy-1792 TaxID=2608339 RepID=UPI00141F25F3|nr:aminotransferase class I/II-fold pyridoxal phosphate-dependent enzyme [Chitinophaga sp. Cy-1792]NIG54850.1 aspartate aminotransferase family protein [Chitinophaga sp. Cy-1792]